MSSTKVLQVHTIVLIKIGSFQERLVMVADKQVTSIEQADVKKRHLSDDDDDVSPTSTKAKKGRPKKGSKRTKVLNDGTENLDTPVLHVTARKVKDSVQEISPFENVLTYKCNSCTKRSQDVKRIETHLREGHPGRNQAESGYKILSRDQVVDSLTKFVAGRDGDQNNQFACFYCEVNTHGKIIIAIQVTLKHYFCKKCFHFL